MRSLWSGRKSFGRTGRRRSKMGVVVGFIVGVVAYIVFAGPINRAFDAFLDWTDTLPWNWR